MAEKNRIVGRGDWKTSKIVQKLSSSGSFHLLLDTWEDVCHDLEIDRVVIKTGRKDFNNDKISFKSLLEDMLDTWVGQKDSNAYLDDLLKAFKDNGMEALAEHLRGEPDSVNKQPKKYCRFPQTLTEFFSSKSKSRTIISTPDTSITCQKIKENSKNCLLLDVKGFLLEASKDHDSGTCMSSPYVISVITLDEVEKVFKAATSFPVEKLLIITREPEEKLNEFTEKFQIVKDEMEWDDLSPIFQFEIEEELHRQVGMHIQDLTKTVCGKILVDLINNVELKLFENTIPEELLVSYYIPRVIIDRRLLDKEKLFQDNSIEDIFLFTGLNMVELRRYVRTGMTGISSESLNTEISKDSRFIVLQNLNHFPVICRNNSNKSVHWIKVEDQEFHWVKTCGSMKIIQKMINLKPIKETIEDEYTDEDTDEEDTEDDTEDDVDTEQQKYMEFKEAEFVDKVASSNETRVVCLADTPGMGKSALLGSIGKQLKDIPDSSKIVIFLTISDLIKSMEVLDNKNLESALHDLACKNNLEKEIISEKLTSSNLVIELLLDGFDEVGWERIDLAFKLLQFIQGFNSVRLWVGTRPHYLKKLEQKMNTIGYNIKPFIKEDQVNFLQSFWKSRNEGLCKSKLDKLAKKVLETLSSTTRVTSRHKNEVEIAGIPLQCHMLAQIYEKSAVLCCSSNENNTENIPVLLDINSVTALYEALVKHKFQKYQKTYSGQGQKLCISRLYSMHSKLALELIFPDWFDNNLTYLFDEAIKIEDLLNVGLLDRRTGSSTNNFIHRTFAEYFCAYFIAKNMLKNEFLNKEFIDFFYDEFLFVSNYETYTDFEYDLARYSRNFVTCYFLNCLVLNHDAFIKRSSSLSPTMKLPTKDISPEEIQRNLLACSNHNFQALFSLFTELPNFEKNIDDIIDESFLIYSIEMQEFKMFEIILSHFKKHARFTARLSSKVLHAAVASFNSKKLEYFLKVEGLFDKLLGKPDVELGQLFESYFRSAINSCMCKAKLINSNVIDTIRLLIEIEEGVYAAEEDNILLLQSKTSNWHWALLHDKIEVWLRLELIKLGANIFQTDTGKNNFLHLYGFSNPEFLQYFEAISPQKLKILVQMKNYKGFTPLVTAFKKNVLFSKEFMKKWKEAGTDFTEIFCGDPLFLLAIESGNGKEVLQFMIDNGVEVRWRDDLKYNENMDDTYRYMDYAVLAGNFDAVWFLINERGMNVNGIDKDSNSPLDCLIQNWKNDFSEKHFRAAQELWKLGGRLNLTLQEDLQKFVFQHRDLLFLKFVLTSGIDVNKEDIYGNNLLHLLVMNWPNSEAIEMALKAGTEKMTKNKRGLIPLDLAFINARDINILRLLKPFNDFKWSSVSPLVNGNDFQRIFIWQAHCISDKEEFLSLFEQSIYRSIKSTETDTCLHSLFGPEYTPCHLSPSQFNWITDYLLKDKDRVQLFINLDKNGATPLHYAVKNIKGIEENTLKVLQQITDFKLKDKNGKSLLFYAVDGNQTPEFLGLLNKYARMDFLDEDNKGQNLLHAVSTARTPWPRKESLEMVNFLIKKGVDPNWTDVNGNTPLHINSEKWTDGFHIDLDFSMTILKNGAKTDIKNFKGETFFDIFCRNCYNWMANGEVFRLIWRFNDTTQKLSFTTLRLSIDDIAKLIFDYFKVTDEEFIYFTNEILDLMDLVNSMSSDWYKDYFPFEKWGNRLTSSSFHLLVENLIENGREFFFSKTEQAMQALHHIVSKIIVEERTIKLLQENGIDLGVKDQNGWSLLFHAIQKNGNRLKYLKLLEKYGGGNMRDKDNSGKSLLHAAVRYLHENSVVIEYLLERVGLDPNEVDNEGNTPLHILLGTLNAILYVDTIPKVQAFIEARSNIFIENSKGETVADLANRITDCNSRQERLLAILSASKGF